MPPNTTEAPKSQLRAVDFFCGAGGMSYGLFQAGIQVLGGVDNAPDCSETYQANILGAKYVEHDITTLTAAELVRQVGIRRNDPDLVFSGCSPCDRHTLPR
jgi:DNA (cytosine-5)-methyltransferase 1